MEDRGEKASLKSFATFLYRGPARTISGRLAAGGLGALGSRLQVQHPGVEHRHLHQRQIVPEQSGFALEVGAAV
jgi:hypothetical protein